jgi:hypothetical protein
LSATIERNLDEHEPVRTPRPQLFSERFFPRTRQARIELRRFANHEETQKRRRGLPPGTKSRA